MGIRKDCRKMVGHHGNIRTQRRSRIGGTKRTRRNGRKGLALEAAPDDLHVNLHGTASEVADVVKGNVLHGREHEGIGPLVK